jgi:hypothetical protein
MAEGKKAQIFLKKLSVGYLLGFLEKKYTKG